MSHRHAWLRLRIGGQAWGAYLVNPGHRRLLDEHEHVYGIAYPEEGRIYLSRGQTESALEDSLVHELLHATMAVSGAGHAIGDAAKEETVVRALTPVWHRLLLDLGLRFPKVNP